MQPAKRAQIIFISLSLPFFLVLFLLASCQSAKTGPSAQKLTPALPVAPKVEKATENEVVFAVFGDNRPMFAFLPQPKAFRQILKEVKKVHPELIVLTGDCVYGSSNPQRYEQQYQEFASLLKETGLSYLIAIGNHDAQNKMGIKLFKKYLQRQTYLAFYFKNCLFIILDSESQPGQIGSKQMKWLENVLKKYDAQNIFVFLHRPLFSLMNPEGFKDKHLALVSQQERRQLTSLFKKYKVKIIFAGHEHFFNQSTFEGLNQVIAGCAGAPPYTDRQHGGFPHFVLVEVKGNKVKLTVIKSNGEKLKPDEILTPQF